MVTVDSYKKERIFHFKNVISEEDCKELIDTIDIYTTHTPKLDHKLGNNIRAYVIDPSFIDDKNKKDKCDKIIIETIKNLTSTINQPELVKYVERVELRKIWGKTKNHIDGIVSDPDSRHLLRTMSVIVCLNSDYDGGELCFPEQDFKIKLKAGEVLVFPPYWTHPHYSNELKNDTYRYTITTWFCQ